MANPLLASFSCFPSCARRELQKVLSRVVLKYQLGHLDAAHPHLDADGLINRPSLQASENPLYRASKASDADEAEKAAQMKDRLGDWGFVFEDPLDTETPNAANVQQKFFADEGDDFVRLADWLEHHGHPLSAGEEENGQEQKPRDGATGGNASKDNASKDFAKDRAPKERLSMRIEQAPISKADTEDDKKERGADEK
eukprot:scaffold3747_cov240-Pinguiococcus_pyrenoidosus.AAC.7